MKNITPSIVFGYVVGEIMVLAAFIFAIVMAATLIPAMGFAALFISTPLAFFGAMLCKSTREKQKQLSLESGSGEEKAQPQQE